MSPCCHMHKHGAEEAINASSRIVKESRVIRRFPARPPTGGFYYWVSKVPLSKHGL